MPADFQLTLGIEEPFTTPIRPIRCGVIRIPQQED